MKKGFVVLVLTMLFPALASAQLDLRGTSAVMTKANASSTGTTVNLLAKITSTGALLTTTTDTGIPSFLVIGGAGTTGSATLLVAGPGKCVMDANNASGVAGYYILPSALVDGRCNASASPPASGYVLGYLLDDTTTIATVANVLMIPQPFVPGSGAGTGTVNTGALNRLAVYVTNPTGTTVDDLAAAPTANRFLKGDGTNWTTSSVSGGGAGSCTNQAVTAVNADAVPTCTTLTSAYVNNTIALTGTDINTSSEVTGALKSFGLKGDTSPTALSGNVNDYNPSGLADTVVLRINGGAADRTITGIAGGADGRILVVRNVGTTNSLILPNQSASSTAANRFLFGEDITLTVGQSMAIQYDTTSSRWYNMVSGHRAASPTGTVGATVVPGALTTFMRSDAAPPLASKYRTWTCEVHVGDPGSGSAALAADNDTPDACVNQTGVDKTITAVACKVNSGSVTMTPIFTGGSATSIVTGAITCGTSWTAGTVNGTPTLKSFSGAGATCAVTPCTIDVNLTTVDGAAKYVSLVLTGTY